MGNQYQSAFARKYVAEGRLEGLRLAIRSVLQARNVPLAPTHAEQLDACTDVAKLTDWHQRAITAVAAADIFDGK